MSLFTRINVISNDLTMPIIPDSDVNYFLPLESESYEHWMFNRGAASLVGIVNGKRLAVGATAPVFGSYAVSLTTTPAGALKTDKSDSANQTMCVVYRRPAVSSLRYLAGSLDTTSGSSLIATGTALGAVYANQRPSAQIGPVNHPGMQGDWVFAALSEKSNPASKDQILFVGGQAPVKTNVGSKVLATHPIALCNGYDNSVANSTIEFAEFVLFDRSLTEVELGLFYQRARLRMGQIGIMI